jgi:hypothetical protein
MDCSHPHHFEESQERGCYDAVRGSVAENGGEHDRIVLDQQPAVEVVDHLADGNGVGIDVEGGPTGRALGYLAEDGNQVK